MVQCSRHVIPPAITADLADQAAHDLLLELSVLRTTVLTAQRLGIIIAHVEDDRLPLADIGHSFAKERRDAICASVRVMRTVTRQPHGDL